LEEVKIMQINVEKRHLYFLSLFIVVVGGVIFVTGQGVNPNPGHWANDLAIDLNDGSESRLMGNFLRQEVCRKDGTNCNGSYSLITQANGKIGINQPNPQAMLDVVGTTKMSGDLKVKMKSVEFSGLGGCNSIHDTGVKGILWKYKWNAGGEGYQATKVQLKSSVMVHHESILTDNEGTVTQEYGNITISIPYDLSYSKCFVDYIKIWYLPIEGI